MQRYKAAAMRIRKLALLALVAERVHGYLDTSPFFLFSTSELLLPNRQLQSAASLTSDISHTLSQCPSDIYVLVTQPGVSALDYTSLKSTTGLARHMVAGEKNATRSSTSVADVVGEIDTNRWQEILEKDCGARSLSVDQDIQPLASIKGRGPVLLKASLPVPSLALSSETLKANDVFFTAILDRLPSQNYTVLYITTPSVKRHGQPVSEASEYEMETAIEEVMHLDLKRNVDFRPRQSSNNQTLVNGPLFDKYQFLSPGIFMGFLAGLILLSILYTAISGVASMQVTYAAFDKESGQSGQKKTQ